jgi:nucleotide sugar dehydrogenase
MINRLEERHVCVVGTGKIGLPLAVFLSKKFMVYGFDLNSDLIKNLNQKVNVLQNEPGVHEQMKIAMEANNLKFTSTLAEVSDASIYIVTVPLLLNDYQKPDFSALDQAIKDIALRLRDKDLVIIETTIPVGTLRNRIKNLLETDSKKICGTDFFLAYSPERVQSGTFFRDLALHPKLVGAIDRESCEKASEFYAFGLSSPGLTTEVIQMTNSETAEMTKLAECVYRDVNIALANEFHAFADNNQINIHEVINAANSQYQSNIHKPGISVGGHCIPVYPHLLLSSGFEFPLVSLARGINKGRPSLALKILESKLGNLQGKSILVMGICYRPGVKELANSGGIEVANYVNSRGGRAHIIDPMYSKREVEMLGFLSGEYDQSYDAIVLVTEHTDFLNKLDFLQKRSKLIIDGRNMFEGESIETCEIVSLG